MTEIVDFFFADYPTVQARRLRAALDDGLAHGSRIEPQDPLPDQAVNLTFSSRVEKGLEYVAVYYTVDGSEPQGTRGVVKHGQVVLAEATYVEQGEVQTWLATLPAQAEGTLVRYRAEGWSASSEEIWSADRVDPVTVPESQGRVFAYHVDNWHTPAWWRDAIVYQIFVDRFSAGEAEPALREHDEIPITDFYGGTLQGVIEKLDYIQALGCTCIWLSPIFESPTPHGYNPSCYHRVAQRYGGDQKLLELVREVHKRGMRILLDFVANHTSDEHSAFVEARHDVESHKRQWYDFETWPGFYRSYAMVDAMPELSTDNAGVREYLYSAAQYWLNYFGADGLRLDYVPGPSHAFWTGYQQTVKTDYPEALTIGEITSPMPEIAQYAGRMDGFMDFPLAKITRSTFASRANSLEQLLSYLDERASQMPMGMSTGTLLDNHDTHRFLWLADDKIERLKLAAVFHMTLEGTPIIYYGTEIGLSQYADAHKENAYCRAPMFWDGRQDISLFAHYQQLTRLRHNHEVLRTGVRTSVMVEAVESSQHKQVGAYLRHNGDEYMLIVLNNNEQETRVKIHLGAALAGNNIRWEMSDVLRNMLEPEQVTAYQEGFEVEVSALGFLVLGRERIAAPLKVDRETVDMSTNIRYT